MEGPTCEVASSRLQRQGTGRYRKQVHVRGAEINPVLGCALCGHYLREPLTVVECMHSICRQCFFCYLDGLREGGEDQPGSNVNLEHNKSSDNGSDALTVRDQKQGSLHCTGGDTPTRPCVEPTLGSPDTPFESELARVSKNLPKMTVGCPVCGIAMGTPPTLLVRPNLSLQGIVEQVIKATQQYEARDADDNSQADTIGSISTIEEGKAGDGATGDSPLDLPTVPSQPIATIKVSATTPMWHARECLGSHELLDPLGGSSATLSKCSNPRRRKPAVTMRITKASIPSPSVGLRPQRLKPSRKRRAVAELFPTAARARVTASDSGLIAERGKEGRAANIRVSKGNEDDGDGSATEDETADPSESIHSLQQGTVPAGVAGADNPMRTTNQRGNNYPGQSPTVTNVEDELESTKLRQESLKRETPPVVLRPEAQPSWRHSHTPPPAGSILQHLGYTPLQEDKQGQGQKCREVFEAVLQHYVHSAQGNHHQGHRQPQFAIPELPAATLPTTVHLQQQQQQHHHLGEALASVATGSYSKSANETSRIHGSMPAPGNTSQQQFPQQLRTAALSAGHPSPLSSIVPKPPLPYAASSNGGLSNVFDSRPVAALAETNSYTHPLSSPTPQLPPMLLANATQPPASSPVAAISPIALAERQLLMKAEVQQQHQPIWPQHQGGPPAQLASLAQVVLPPPSTTAMHIASKAIQRTLVAGTRQFGAQLPRPMPAPLPAARISSMKPMRKPKNKPVVLFGQRLDGRAKDGGAEREHFSSAIMERSQTASSAAHDGSAGLEAAWPAGQTG